MAYSSKNSAYDLSLFDDEAIYSSAAPKREREDELPQRRRKNQRKEEKILKFSEENVYKSRKRRHSKLKIFLGAFSAVVVTCIIGVIIVGQVRLTELNEDIIDAQTALTDAQSIYTQNQMKLEANLSNAEIEKYATEVLGMTKASNAQKEFISLESGDRAEVSVQKNENIFTQFIDSLKNLWS